MKNILLTIKKYIGKPAGKLILVLLAVALTAFAVGGTLAKYVIDLNLQSFSLNVYRKYDIYYGAAGYATLGENTGNPASYSKVTGEITLNPAQSSQEGYTFAGWLATTDFNTAAFNTAVTAEGSSAFDDLFITRLVVDESDASVTAYNAAGDEIWLNRDASHRICLYALYKAAYWTIGNTITTYTYNPTRGYLVNDSGQYYNWNVNSTDFERDANGLPMLYAAVPSRPISTYNSKAYGAVLDSSTNPIDVTATQYIGSSGDLLVIEGSGDISAFAFTFIQHLGSTVTTVTPPWAATKGTVNRVVIPDDSALTPTFLTGWFDGMTNLSSVYIGSGVDTSQMSNMDYTFRNCSNLSSITGLNNIEGTRVFQSRGTFQNCASLTQIDMTGFINPNTPSQGNTNYTLVHLNDMFSGCTNLVTIVGLEQLDTTQFYDIGGLFRNCSSLKGDLLLRVYGNRVTFEPVDGSVSAADRQRIYEDCLKGTSTEFTLHFTTDVRVSLMIELIHTSDTPADIHCRTTCSISGCTGSAYTVLHDLLNGTYVEKLTASDYATNTAVMEEFIQRAAENNPYEGYSLNAFQIRQGNSHDVGYARITADPADQNAMNMVLALSKFSDPSGGNTIYLQPIYKLDKTEATN